MISRMSLIEVCDAASISMTSTWRPSMIALQWTPSSLISIVGRSTRPGISELSARAKIRAVVVLPTPRTPVSM